MKKRLSILVASALALVLSFALVGCGGGESKDYSANFAGDWKLSGMEDASGVTSEEDIAMLEAFGMTIKLSLADDKSAKLDLAGEVMTGTWEAKSATECAVTLDGETVTATLSDDKLVMKDGESSMTFKKMTAEEAASLPASGSASGSLGEEVVDSSFAPVNIADDDICTIKVVGKMTDEFGDSGYVMSIVNKSDKAIYVTVPFDSTTVNGKMVDIWGGETLLAGASIDDAFFYADAEDVPSLEAMTAVKGKIEVWDDDSLDTLASYDFSLN
ncbi:MAG: hypothetical protein IKL97_06105 [Eggerthellaceae bacterium]|nr:hypothetical protein [Eggerthellaceae bacterium]